MLCRPLHLRGLFIVQNFLDVRGCAPIFALLKTSRVRLRARTPPFHGGNTGSNPVRGTNTFFSLLSAATSSFFYSFIFLGKD